jgi:hypothetical protein
VKSNQAVPNLRRADEPEAAAAEEEPDAEDDAETSVSDVAAAAVAR